MLGVIAALVALGACAMPLRAAASPEIEPQKPTTTRVEPVGHWAYSRLTRAHEALSDENYEEALAELDDMRRNTHLNAHERASMWQTYGYLQAAQGEHEKAAESFEKCLAEAGLPPTSQLSTRKNLAQIHLMLGNYVEVVAQFEQWGAETEEIGADGHYMLALAYAHSGDQDKALPHAESAVALSTRPHEGRLQLLSAIYFRSERFEDLVPVLSQLVEAFSKKTYWMQLSAVYSQLDRYQEALAVQEAAYEQGMLSENRELITLARLFLHNDVPYEAAKVLEEGLAKGVVEDGEEAWGLLGSSYLQAREYEKALKPLAHAAELSGTGDGYVRLGEVYLGEARFDEARRALGAALNKGSLDDTGRAHLLLGIANSSEERFDEAKRSFVSAQAFEQYAAAAKQWIEFVEREATLHAEEAAYSDSARKASKAPREDS